MLVLLLGKLRHSKVSRKQLKASRHSFGYQILILRNKVDLEAARQVVYNSDLLLSVA